MLNIPSRGSRAPHTGQTTGTCIPLQKESVARIRCRKMTSAQQAALMDAIDCGDKLLVELLIAAGANVDATTTSEG